MASLIVKLLDESAKAPTVAHPGEDIGYDLYANLDHTLIPGRCIVFIQGWLWRAKRADCLSDSW